MTYVPADNRYDAHAVPPLRAAAACSCRPSRSASGTTSATTARSRPAARSSAAPSTSASPTSTWPTTTGRRTDRPRRTSARCCESDLRPYRDELVISTKAGYDMWPGPYGEWGSRKYLLASLDQSLRPDGARLRRHLLLAPVRPRHAARGDDGRARHRGAPGQGALRRHLLLLGGADARGGRDPARARHAAADPPAVVLDAQPLDRGRTCSTRSASSASAASPSRRSPRGC